MFLRINAKFEPGSIMRNFGKSIWTMCTICTIYLLPGIMKGKITMKKECSKTTKTYQKLIRDRIGKAPYLVQYTNIGKVIRRFQTAAFTDSDQCHFVLKLSGLLSFIILNLCAKKEDTRPRFVKISCQKISATRKSQEGWPLTFWQKYRRVAPSFHLPLEYEVKRL